MIFQVASLFSLYFASFLLSFLPVLLSFIPFPSFPPFASPFPPLLLTSPYQFFFCLLDWNARMPDWPRLVGTSGDYLVQPLFKQGRIAWVAQDQV